MFQALSDKLEATFRKLSGRGKLSEADVDVALEEIRIALLEADVNLSVVKDFCSAVKKNAVGQELHKSLNPSQVVLKVVYQELVNALGEQVELRLRFAPPVIIMLVGLQGSGKTTTSGKLAGYLKRELKRRPLLVPADVYRPAAIDQLKTVGGQLGVDVFPSSADQDPVEIAKLALAHAEKAGFDTVIIDTAGRLQIDAELMNELVEIVEAIEPHEILLVADSMTGQEAVNVAQGFNERLDIDGLILTKLDGDARGGAALSMRAVTQKPIKFIGIGEKLDALEPFFPDRLVSRILGMGDVKGLIEKATKQVTLEDAKKLEKKLKKDEFTLEDFHSQLQTIKSMGSLGSLMGMIPGMSKVANAFDENQAESGMKRIEAIIRSMTLAERRNVELLDGSRRRRIASGSGTSVEEVNSLLRQFSEMRKMMKKLTKLGPNAMRGLGGLNLGRFPGGR